MRFFRQLGVFIAVFSLVLTGLFGQTNQMLDEILAQDSLSLGHGAYILLVTSQAIDEASTPAQAVEELLAYDSGSRFANHQPTDTIDLGEFVYLTQDILEIPRGLWSSVFPGPRYSLRDLEFLGIIQGQAATHSIITGERALRIINRALSERERRQ
ncbi:MAG: hypothetical protein GW949_10275 [Spirochaetales bacterium]|nr:hypothetical protein [Spirochaetales bacterium]